MGRACAKALGWEGVSYASEVKADWAWGDGAGGEAAGAGQYRVLRPC